MTTRGVRNNNPGNIEKGDDWQGLSKDQSKDPRFAVFDAPKWGIRAIVRILMNYQRKGGRDTIAKMISRWAPPGGMDHNYTDVYIAQVAKAVGVNKDSKIDITQYAVAAPFVKAMIRVECANYEYPEDVIDEGLALAGVVKS